MKISTGMVEAGVAAFDKVSRTRQSPEAIVSAVYTAMQAVRDRDDKTTPTSERSAYVHQAWPAWRESPSGERRVFQSAADVPEGWGPVGKTATDTESAPPADERPALREAYKAKFGKAPNAGWDAVALREKLAA